MAALGAIGARPAESVAELVGAVDLVHICVAYAEQVEDLVTGADGVLAASRPGQVVVVHSTVPPVVVRRCAEAAAERGVDLLDAPVSGARKGAESGTLTLMVGGDAAVLVRCLPVLETMASRVVRVGPVGAGQATKLANNIMSQGNRLLYLEALSLAEAYGVSEDALNDVVSTSTGASWAQTNIEFLDQHGVLHTDAGTPEHPYRFAKDLRYAAEIAESEGLDMPLTVMSAEVAPEAFRRRWARGSSHTRPRG
jgi:3-hydroxyisobutyrate dehydrogenase